MKTVVYVRGGIVQGILTDHDHEVLIIDYDTEDADDDSLLTIDNDKVHAWKENEQYSTRDDEKAEKIFKEFELRTAEQDLKDRFSELPTT